MKIRLKGNAIIDKAVASFIGYDFERVKFYETDTGCLIIKSEDGPQMIKHISVSNRDRYPTWDEIKEVKYYFYPDIEMAMYFPKKGDYVNISKNCFHLYEVK